MSWRFGAPCGVVAVAVAMEFVHDGTAYNTTYASGFTERRTAPGNTYSSLVYAALACYLAQLRAPARPRACATEAVILLWFAYLSFRYHHTTSRWHGSLDLWCVTYLCMSCLSRYLYSSDKQAVLFTWVAMVPLLADVAMHAPDNNAVVSFSKSIIGLLVYMLLACSVGKWRQFLAFALAFVAKVIDMELAKQGVHTTSPVNGTSLFHVLTGVAMYFHYREMFGTLETPPNLEQERAEEFGAGYEQSQRWLDLKAGKAVPTLREQELLNL